MNEHSNTDKPQVDQHVLDLLNGAMDGELNATERAELDSLLASSDHASDLYLELIAINSVLDQAPEHEPPEYLQSAIEKQVRLPVADDISEEKQGRFTRWLNTNWLRSGFALTAAVLLTVGVYQMGSGPISDQDSRNLVGTVAKKPLSIQESLLGSILVNTDELSGVVELRNTDDLFFLDIQLDSDVPSEVIVNFSGRGLEFEDIVHEQDDQSVIKASDGLVNLVSTGGQHYTMRLRRTSTHENTGPLTVAFIANNKLVREAELSFSQQ